MALAFALAFPTEFSLNLGGLRLSPYRIVLIACFFPAIAKLFAPRMGGRIATDWLFLGFAGWAVVSLAANHGVGTAIESGGILFVETFGSYLVGRTAIRGIEDYRALVMRLILVAAIVLAVSLPETLTGTRFVHQFAGSLFGGAPNIHVEPRYGLHRAFGPFDHPILAGVFGSTLVALAWSCRRHPTEALAGRVKRTLIAFGAGMTSLSSAAILAMALQGALFVWRRLTAAVEARWRILGAILLAFYTAVSMLSDRSGLQALMWYLCFDRQTASYRLLIWEHGAVNVGANKWFGLGQNDWVRPEWMSNSVDSFWLLTTMTYGLPATTFLALALIAAMRRAGSAVRGDDEGAQLRRGWIFAYIALAFCGFTVHYWNNVFTMIGLLLGAAGWMGNPDRAPVRAARA